jgi:hypothetical protein
MIATLKIVFTSVKDSASMIIFTINNENRRYVIGKLPLSDFYRFYSSSVCIIAQCLCQVTNIAILGPGLHGSHW